MLRITSQLTLIIGSLMPAIATDTVVEWSVRQSLVYTRRTE